MSRPTKKALHSVRVTGLAAGATKVVTTEQVDSLRSAGDINFVAIMNESGQLIEGQFNGDPEQNVYLGTGRSYIMSNEINIRSVLIKNLGGGAFNDTGVIVTLARVSGISSITEVLRGR